MKNVVLMSVILILAACSASSPTGVRAKGGVKAVTTIASPITRADDGDHKRPLSLDDAYARFIARYKLYPNRYLVAQKGSDQECSQSRPCPEEKQGGRRASNHDSYSFPFATIEYASAHTPPCAVIWVGDGNYDAVTTKEDGDPSCHKAFVSQNYGGAKINGSVNSGGAYVDFVGFEVTAPFSCTGFFGPGWPGPGSTSYSYTDIFAYNRVHDIDNASGAPACNGIGGMAGGQLYYGNVIWNIGTQGNRHVHGIYADLGARVENNVVYNTTGGCIHVGRNPADVTVVNNTLYNCKWGVVLYTMSGSVTPSGNYVANNIIANAGQYGIIECYATDCAGTPGGQSTYSNNITYNAPNRMENGVLLNNSTANPNVVSAGSPAAGADYHLRAGSSARGTGNRPKAPQFDIDGNPRGNPPSIGAYE
jgi:hypothetical protein